MLTWVYLFVAPALQTCRRYDDEIFEHIMREFPEFATEPHAGLVTLDEDWMKSKEGKERWRAFINAYVACPFSSPPCLFIANLTHARRTRTDMRRRSQISISAH
jgi:hypothetical protein